MLVTHTVELVGYGSRSVRMAGGRIVDAGVGNRSEALEAVTAALAQFSD